MVPISISSRNKMKMGCAREREREMTMTIAHKNKILLLLAGWMECGKDTVGAYLVEKYQFKRYAFADILKDEVAALYEVDRPSFDDPVLKRMPCLAHSLKTRRQLMIEYGAVRRLQDSNYWADKLCDAICRDGPERVVITDWRFHDEGAAVEQRLASQYQIYKWRVIRWICPPSHDPSEMQLTNVKYDGIVQNKGTFNQLYAGVEDAMEPILEIIHAAGENDQSCER